MCIVHCFLINQPADGAQEVRARAERAQVQRADAGGRLLYSVRPDGPQILSNQSALLFIFLFSFIDCI